MLKVDEKFLFAKKIFLLIVKVFVKKICPLPPEKKEFCKKLTFAEKRKSSCKRMLPYGYFLIWKTWELLLWLSERWNQEWK